MGERHVQLYLPTAVVTRLIKEALPEGVVITQEAITAFSRSASVFVLYVTSQSNSIALKTKRKKITGQDVLVAMENMECEEFIAPLEKSLSNFKRSQKRKKEATANRKMQNKEETSKKNETTGEELDDENDDEIIEVD